MSHSDPVGQHEEFLVRFTASQPALRRFVFAHVPDRQDAEDVIQRAALVLWRKYGHYDPTKSFTAWALGVTRNEVLHERRSSARDRLVLAEDVAENLAQRLEAQQTPEVDPRGPQLKVCIGRLPERSRRAVEMHYQDGKGTDQIASALNTTLNAVRLILFRARQALAQCVGGSR